MAYLETKDGVRFDLDFTEGTRKKKGRRVEIALPFIEETAFFDLYTYGGNIKEEDPQIFKILLGNNPDDDGALSEYWVIDTYDAGLLEYSLSNEGSIESLKGDTGDKGPDGDAGPIGETGLSGASASASLPSTVTGATTFSSQAILNSSLKLATGAAVNKILGSDANGDAVWLAAAPTPGLASLDAMPDAELTSSSVFVGGDISMSGSNNVILGYKALNLASS